jgi:formylglycine-generating enzyme required for sulfatase activity
VLRGGSFVGWDKELRVTNRQGASPDRKAPWIGFRTAYTEF